MSETFTEPTVPADTLVDVGFAREAPDAPAEAPRSPGEAVTRYSEQAQEIAAAAADPAPLPAFDDFVQPGDEVASLEEWADNLNPEERLTAVADALADMGVLERPAPQPGDANYQEWAIEQAARLEQSNNEALQQLANLTGTTPEHVAQLLDQQHAAEQQRQAAEFQQQVAQYQRDSEVGLSHAAGVVEEIGASYIDPREVLDLARATHEHLVRSHGPEVAAQLAPQVYETAARHLAGEFEELAKDTMLWAQKAGAHLGPNAPDSLEVLNAYEELLPRRMREHDGDEAAAHSAAMSDAIERLRPANVPLTGRQVVQKHYGMQRRLEAMREAAGPDQPAGDPAAKPDFKNSQDVIDHYSRRARELAKEA